MANSVISVSESRIVDFDRHDFNLFSKNFT
jgi:hypothetical protein